MKGVLNMITVKYVYNHYEAYGPSGKFLFSADTTCEVREELEAIEN